MHQKMQIVTTLEMLNNKKRNTIIRNETQIFNKRKVEDEGRQTQFTEMCIKMSKMHQTRTSQTKI